MSVETKERPLALEIPDSPPPPAVRTARDRLLAFEAVLSEIPQFDYPLKHHFAPGLYAREIFIPAGHCVVGHIHRHENLSFLSKGHLRVFTEFDQVEMHPGDHVVACAGTKRAVYSFEDSIFTVVHANPTNERDIHKLEDLFVVKYYAQLEEAPCLM